jgi:ArsR family transcriptional regulator
MKTVTVPTELLDFLKSVASESRMKILLLFIDGQERTVNQISEMVGLEQSTTSEHLALMKRNGLLLSQKSGKEVYYRPDRDKIVQFLDALNQLLSKCC